MCKTNIFFKNLFIVRKNTASTPELLMAPPPYKSAPLFSTFTIVSTYL